MRRSVLFAVLTSLLASTGLLAQDAACPSCTVMATVIDRQGSTPRGLTAANVRGKFRGHPVQILSASLDTSAHRIVLLLDVSSSMIFHKGKWALAKAVATAEAILGM